MIFCADKKGFFMRTHKLVALLLISVFVFSDTSSLFEYPLFRVAEAAQVQIDNSVSTATTEHTILGTASVFISDQVGYKFYVDLSGACVYSKTTDGGTSWGGAVTFDAQTDCMNPTIWYDQWTPGDTGTYIHIIDSDTSVSDVFYNRLDTTSDTLLLGTAATSTVLGQSALSLSAATNKQSITKGTDGTIYIAVNDGSDAFVVECTTNCNLSGSWTETGTNTMNLGNDFPLLMPLSGGNIMLIVRDILANDIEYKTWNNTAWSGAWLTIDANAIENTTYDVGMAATLGTSTDEIFLAYVADNGTLGTDDDIRTAKYSGGSWTNTTNVRTNDTKGLQQVAIGVDTNKNEVYVAYSARTTPGTIGTSNVYWASSTAAMTTWGTEQGPINTTAGDIYGIDLNIISNERVYASWYEANVDDMFGNTIADIGPDTVASVSGTQGSTYRAGTSTLYVGGKFAIKSNLTSRNVTDIVITENGTVDAANDLNNIKLLYDLDTSAPYDCASESYSGSESQFGSTDTNGFSGSNGTSAFTSSVTVTPTQTMCFYTVLDILSSADDLTTLEIEVSNPATDILVSGGATVVPSTVLAISGSTNIVNSILTQTHYHWRYDDGNETGATSRTSGNEDTPLTAIQQNTPRRLRFGISNEGSTSTLATTLRLEYASNPSTCDVASGWTDINATDDAWNLSDSTFITNGTNSTDISNAIGGVTNENSVFLTPNGGLRDTSSSINTLTFLPTNWTEAEFSVVASTSSVEGDTYCFRLTDAGQPLPVYLKYPSATVAADVSVSATGTQISTIAIPTTNFYTGGKFVIKENSGSRNVTGITINEAGTIDATTGVSNVRLYYDLDTSNPYDCASESYSGSETQFGSATSSFDAVDGYASFTDSIAISTTQSLCVYPVLNVTESANNSETIDIKINSGSSDVIVSGGGSVSPSTQVDIASSTALVGAIVTQTHYHWRNDDGNETGATSATGGTEDTALIDFEKSQPVRLRIGISNEGATSSIPYRYGLEYGIKSSSCDLVSVWTDADGGGVSWSMYDSPNLTNGQTTTNIAVGSGGVTDANASFLGTNGGVRDTESFSATTTLTSTEHTDLEYSIQTTAETPYDTTFCFRVTRNGVALLQYDQYAEVTTVPKRDFKIQRGTTIVTGTGVTLVAGTNYVAPAASTSAFVRITNSHYTGAGKNTLGGNQNSRDYVAYISNPSNIQTNFTISRETGAINNTYVDWEIIEYIGPPGGDNEIIVRSQDVVTYGIAVNTNTGPAVPSVVDDADVVVFITGQGHDGANRTEAFAHQSTSNWLSSTNQPEFTRGANGGNTGQVSYAVVEFVGLNWKIQRAEHSYTAVNTTETESITAVNSLARTFIHSQKRYAGGSSGMDDFGHDVWLSSIGAVSFYLPVTADILQSHVSVAWVIENTQTATGEMVVQRSNSATTGGLEPFLLSVPLSTALNATNNASIFTTTYHDEIGTNYPRMIAGVTILDVNNYQLWRSDSGGLLTYRTEVVQWPAADLAVRQNYYRFYDDNDALLPTDAWPPGGVNLGENTSIGSLDEPLADSQHIRIRMTAKVVNATLPTGFLEVKLQYGLRSTTCSAVAVWSDVGAPGSGAIWRGYNAAGVTDGTSLSGNPPTGGDLLISVADRAGRYTESNPASANQYGVLEGEDVEYDWNIEQNGAAQRSTYCFRMIKVDDTELDGYLYYPEIRTEGFTPITNDWRWYDDETNETPIVPRATENSAPIEILIDETLKLRVAVDEIKNLSQINARFRLQFAKNSDFSDATDVVSTTTCSSASEWCYYDGAGVDNALIQNAVLSSSDTCVAGVGNGCGTHVESANYSNGFTHTASQNKEYEFTLQYKAPQKYYGRVYYFRLYDTANDEAVVASSTYPSAVIEATKLIFSIAGVDANVTTAGVTTDATSTPTTINFGSLPVGTDVVMAQRISVNTNGTEGYQILKYADQQLINSYGTQIEPVTSSNATPASWATACSGLAVSCFGYHTTDATLENASARFAPTDSYSALSTSLEEVMYSSVPANDTEDIVYRIMANTLQPAGIYETGITYIAVPVF